MHVSIERLPPLHVLVSRSEIEDATSLDLVRRLVETVPGIAVHLRARVPASVLYETARDIAGRAWATGGWCVVNGRPDIALAASARAVQLGRAALPVAAVRRLFSGAGGVGIGASVHSPDEAARAAADGADFIVAGTAYPTPSHPGDAGVGPSGIATIVDASGGVPVLAIGGVDATRVEELAGAGVAGVVVSRAVWGVPDPIEGARTLFETLGRALAR